MPLEHALVFATRANTAIWHVLLLHCCDSWNGSAIDLTIATAGKGYDNAFVTISQGSNTVNAFVTITAGEITGLSLDDVDISSLTAGDALTVAVSDAPSVFTVTAAGASDEAIFDITYGGYLKRTDVGNMTLASSPTGGADLAIQRAGGQMPTVTLGAPNQDAAYANGNKVQATASAIVSDAGEITGFEITNPGAGYKTTPAVTIEGSTTSSAAAVGTAVLSVGAVLTVSEAIGANEVQTINLNSVITGNYTTTLRLDGAIYSSGSINYNDTAAAVRNALRSMEISGADFVVTKTGALYAVEFTGSLANRNLELMTLDTTDLIGANATVSETVTGVGSATNEEQVLDLSGVTGGTYSLAFSDDRNSQVYTTANLDWNADADAITTALTDMGSGRFTGDFGVAGDNDIYTVTFQSALAQTNVLTLVINSSALEGVSPRVIVTTEGSSDSALSRNVEWLPESTGTYDSSGTISPLVVTEVIKRLPTTTEQLLGTGEAYDTVDLIEIHSDSTETNKGSTTVDSYGKFRFLLDNSNLTAGSSLEVRSQRSSSVSGVVTYNTEAPQISVATVAGDDIVTYTELDKIVELRGTAGLDAASITLDFTGLASPITITHTASTGGEILAGDGSLSWRIKLPASAISGLTGIEHTLSYKVSDKADPTAAGANSTVLERVVSFAVTRPTTEPHFGTSETPLSVLDTISIEPALTGTGATAGATVKIFDLATYDLTATVTADSNGNWSVSASDYGDISAAFLVE